ncbi:hypothetical protein [Dyadobacter arcticus]|uniref:Uncharacterized protein n=1 Tax=Dyadobacter arcticus TaxID=1078754 RepID=A0ABX0UER1_9BACT|nr:hypothetical protein [Dyadobacter arcticus]NIJ51488.1 hypothetical protein [Dyadobacter arcticus]
MIRNTITLIMLACVKLAAQPLAGTDDLGRTLPQNIQVGNPKANRQVGMFYFLWHDVAPAKHWDLNEIVTKHPEVLEDFDHPEWGGDPKSLGMYYWGQPIYGYYKADDYWVHLRSIQLLTDAGVDFLVMDATNRLTYAKQADVLMKAMDAVRAQGRKPPKIVFYTNTSSGETMQEAYDMFYKSGAPYRHPECWFELDGKPLIIGISKEAEGSNYKSFFTFRESQWPTEGQKVNGWPWISFTRPQKVHFNSKGEGEIINVSIAQHPNPTAGMGGSAFYGNKDNWGRSCRKGSPGDPKKDLTFGYNMQEQWDFAIEQNVPFVYVTGWNEWIAGKFASHDKNPEHSWFCDQASPEYSRDIEPSLTAGLKDHYYMQLVANISKYKGLEANLPLSTSKTIKNFEDWSDVGPVYKDYTGDTDARNHPGAQTEPATIYVNKTGRNDFDQMKVARDAKNLYFYAKTKSEITPNSGDNWMRLYLDTDRKPTTGWKGYDYRIVGGSTLQQYKAGNWHDVKKVAYVATGNQMMITIPKSFLINLKTPLSLEFKWSDNMQEDGNPLDWYVNGDAAPGGRFNFVLTVSQ